MGHMCCISFFKVLPMNFAHFVTQYIHISIPKNLCRLFFWYIIITPSCNLGYFPLILFIGLWIGRKANWADFVTVCDRGSKCQHWYVISSKACTRHTKAIVVVRVQSTTFLMNTLKAGMSMNLWHISNYRIFTQWQRLVICIIFLHLVGNATVCSNINLKILIHSSPLSSNIDQNWLMFCFYIVLISNESFMMQRMSIPWIFHL